MQFLSTPSARRATVANLDSGVPDGISIHALREEGDPGARQIVHDAEISIHALREEGDKASNLGIPAHYISIHALREEGDRSICSSWMTSERFLSTPSARRATIPVVSPVLFKDISIHALREEGDLLCGSRCGVLSISIHALREEGDFYFGGDSYEQEPDFYPRPPRGGRPDESATEELIRAISIHALREEGDKVLGKYRTKHG